MNADAEATRLIAQYQRIEPLTAPLPHHVAFEDVALFPHAVALLRTLAAAGWLWDWGQVDSDPGTLHLHFRRRDSRPQDRLHVALVTD